MVFLCNKSLFMAVGGFHQSRDGVNIPRLMDGVVGVTNSGRVNILTRPR